MAQTFLEMQKAVGRELNMEITDTSPVTLEQVKADLNAGRQIVFNHLLNLNQKYGVRKTKADLVANQSIYTFPHDFVKLLRLEVGYKSETERHKAEEINYMETQHYKFASEVSPCYEIIGDMLQIYPTPDESIENGLYMTYIENPEPMEDDNDISNLPFPNYDYLIVLYATAKGKNTLGLMAEGNNFMAQFNNGLVEMATTVIDRNEDGGGHVVNLDRYY